MVKPGWFLRRPVRNEGVCGRSSREHRKKRKGPKKKCNLGGWDDIIECYPFFFSSLWLFEPRGERRKKLTLDNKM